MCQYTVYGCMYMSAGPTGARKGSGPLELELLAVTSDLPGAATMTYHCTTVSKATGPVSYRLKPRKQ